MDEAAVLAYDPWAGDRDSDARTLRDSMVTTRKPSTCAICLEDIPSGSRVRAQTQQSTEMGKVMTFKFCPTCCQAMSVAADDWNPIEERTRIGMGLASDIRRRLNIGYPIWDMADGNR